MRILITLHQFLPDFSAGTEIIAFVVARDLVAAGHEVQIAAGFPGPPIARPDELRLDHYQYHGITVHRFTHAYVPMGGEENIARLEHDNPLFARFFSRILQQFKPDLVHAYHLARLSTSLIDVAHQAGIPVVFTATDFWFICPLSQLLLPGNRLCGGPSWNAGNCIQHLALVQKDDPFRRALYCLPTVVAGAAAGLVRRGWFPPTPFNPLAAAMVNRPALVRDRLRLCRKIIAPSNIMRQTLIAHGIDAGKIVRLAYGIDLDHIQRTFPKARGERLRIGFIGTLAPHKGPQVLIEAVRSLPADLPVALSLHGEGAPASVYPQTLRQLAGKDSRIAFAGAFNNERVSEVLAGIDVLVVPSLWYENTPRVIYEAQAAGCAVLASDLGGMSEAIRPGEDGILFRAGDTAGLASVLRRLCENRDLAAQLAANARPPMSSREHLTQLLELFQELVAPPLPATT